MWWAVTRHSVFFFSLSMCRLILDILNYLQLLRPKQQLRIFFWAEWPMCLSGCTERGKRIHSASRRLSHITGSHSSKAPRYFRLISAINNTLSKNGRTFGCFAPSLHGRKGTQSWNITHSRNRPLPVSHTHTYKGPTYIRTPNPTIFPRKNKKKREKKRKENRLPSQKQLAPSDPTLPTKEILRERHIAWYGTAGKENPESKQPLRDNTRTHWHLFLPPVLIRPNLLRLSTVPPRRPLPLAATVAIHR